jgi:hypothetical protein
MMATFVDLRAMELFRFIHNGLFEDAFRLRGPAIQDGEWNLSSDRYQKL